MSKYKEKPFFPEQLDTYSLLSRDSKVDINSFASPLTPGGSLKEFIESLPDILGGQDFKELLALFKQAKEKKKARIFSLGAHVIKVGLNPVLIDLIEKGWITSLALNGAGIIHDFEIALAGKTSEDVGSRLTNGSFGMAEETGKMLNEAIITAAGNDIGIGEAVGKLINESDFPYIKFSLTAAAYKLGIPVTVHIAIGTDTIHFHPRVNGAALGKASTHDFFLFCSLIKQLDGGGIYINSGSAVILPEIFLKAVTYLRNRGIRLEDFSTAVFDFIHNYRPFQNVVKRPLKGKGKGFYFIGQHEILLPLLAAALQS